MSKSSSFGKRTEPHTIIIAQGQKIRHFTIRPWMAGLTATVFMALAIGYLLSTSYLILRDDLLNTAIARQAKLQHAYEDRIASLRGQVDRITSHRLLDQQFMETKIAELATRQNVLAERSGILGPALDRAKSLGISSDQSDALPIPALRPGSSKAASLMPGIDQTTTGSVPETDALPAVTTLATVKNDLSSIEKAQIRQVAELADAALEKRDELMRAARKAGLPVKAPEASGTGGPYIPANISNLAELFEHEVAAFNVAMTKLEKAKKTIKSFPIAHPAPGKSVSSGFGHRKDPIVGRSAFHGGIDFRTPTGTPIRATANGKVVKAGRHGGYGNLVEIKHANGLSTRYAHLSRIYVKIGQTVGAGKKVGAAGSTGRSTGPHLHYEVRTGGKPINPLNYLKAGARLNDQL